MSRTIMREAVVASPTARIDCDDCGYDGADSLVAAWMVDELRKVAQRHARQLHHRVNFEVLRRTVYEGEAAEW